MLDVGPDRGPRDPELLGNGRRGEPLREQRQHLVLPARELLADVGPAGGRLVPRAELGEIGGEAAGQSVERLSPEGRLRLVARLLEDPIRAVRIEVASAFADVPAARMTTEQRTAVDRALAEYRHAQEINADRAEAHLNLGLLADRRGLLDEAEREYERALPLDPTFVPTYVNLADHYRRRQRDERGEQILRQGLARLPDAAPLHHALGLSLVREQRIADALAALARAAELALDEARYSYV